MTTSFFEESTVYWEPGSDCSVIYEQLAQQKFREIIREQIEWDINIIINYVLESSDS